MAVLRNHYYTLGSELQQERLEAATKLVSELGKADLTEEWDYALNRLIKGLTTTRQSARFGFSMALTELVRELITKETYALTIATFLDKILAASPVASSMKGQEVRATLFGRLFGFQALVNSQLLLDPKESSKDTLLKFVKLVVELASAKPWLRETAMYTLCQFFAAYLKSAMVEDDTTLDFLQIISDQGLMFTPEGLAFVMTMPQEDRGRICLGVQASKNWKRGDPMARDNLPILAQVLKDAEVVDENENDNEDGDNDERPSEGNSLKEATRKGKQKVKQKGTWSPRIPFVWNLMLSHFLCDESDLSGDESADNGLSKKRKKALSSSSKKRAKLNKKERKEAVIGGLIPLREFWKVAVDDTMLSGRSSSGKKFWGLEIFNLFLAKLPSLMVQHLFTPNLMFYLSHSVLPNKILNKIATKTINLIIEITHTDLTKTVPCLQAVLDERHGGGLKFDQLTKSRLLSPLIGVLAQMENPDKDPIVIEALLRDIAHALISTFEHALQVQEQIDTLDGEANVPIKHTNDLTLKWVLTRFPIFVLNTKKLGENANALVETVFKFLLQHAFFQSKTGNNVSLVVRTAVHDRLNTLLSEFIYQKRKDRSWAMYCVKQIGKREKNDKFTLVAALSDELLVVRNECLDMLDTIKQAMKRSPAERSVQYCFELLFAMNLLQLYMGETETVGILTDLKSAYMQIFGDSASTENEKVYENIDASVVLTEILLSFVSKKSSLLKKLSSIVWETFLCAENNEGTLNVNADCFKLLFDVLKAKENEEGQRQLFEGSAEYQEEGLKGDSDTDDSDESDNTDSENEEEYIKPAHSNSASRKLVEMVEEETTKKLASALGIKGDYSGEVKNSDIDSDLDQYESESMDDEQMMAIDGELARIFQERRSALTENSTSKKNSEQNLAKEQMVLFKNRVLDLMDAFSKTQPTSVYNVSFIRPLISLINGTKDKNIGVKAHKLLKTRVSKLKCSMEEVAKVYRTETEVAAFKSLLVDLVTWLQVQAGTYSLNRAHGSACGQSCIILSKCLLSIDPGMLSEIIQRYCTALTEWASQPKNRIQPNMFFEFINWLNDRRVNQK